MRRLPLLFLAALAAVSPAIADDWAEELWNEGKTRVAPFAAPRFEVTPWLGWQWGGRMVFESGGDLQAGAAASYGVILSYRVERQGTLELLVTRHDTDLRFRDGPRGATRSTDAAVTYLQFGGIHETNRGRVRPFGAASLGLTVLDPDGDFSSETRFSFTIGGGVKAWWTPRVGVRFQASWLATVVGASGTVFCGSWGCYATVSGEMVSQGNLTGGLVFGF